jgi:hypothetical protein
MIVNEGVAIPSRMLSEYSYIIDQYYNESFNKG